MTCLELIFTGLGAISTAAAAIAACYSFYSSKDSNKIASLGLISNAIVACLAASRAYDKELKDDARLDNTQPHPAGLTNQQKSYQRQAIVALIEVLDLMHEFEDQRAEQWCHTLSSERFTLLQKTSGDAFDAEKNARHPKTREAIVAARLRSATHTASTPTAG